MPQERRTKISITDKNPVIRTGLIDILTRDGRFEVTMSAATGGALLKQLEEEPERPDIAIIGWALPDMTGGDLLTELRKRFEDIRPIVYTGEQSPTVLRRTIRAGAWGFMSKSDEPTVLIETISSVSHGRVCFPYVDIQALSSDPLAALTVRERELLAALADGWSNLQIAARIGISRNTVKYHLKNLYDKLDVHNRAMAVALYMTRQTQREER